MFDEQRALCPCGAHTKPGALWQCIRGHNILEEQRSQAPAADRFTDTGERDQIARAILDGWYEGNEEWDSPHNDTLQMRAYWAADAVLALATPKSPVDAGAFKRGDRVEKISGSSWRGIVVGEYSTSLTPQGYAVESENEPGSVQIYPAKAIRNLSDDGETM